MAVEAFPFLEVNPLFNESIYFRYIAATEANWKTKLTQHTD
jgi:hypothetical protein